MKKWALLSVLLVNLLDIFTTSLPGGYESNSWARDAYHHPIISHLIIVKIMFYSIWGILALIGYLQLKKYSQFLADIFITGLCLYNAVDFVETLIGNVMIYINWVH